MFILNLFYTMNSTAISLLEVALANTKASLFGCALHVMLH